MTWIRGELDDDRKKQCDSTGRLVFGVAAPARTWSQGEPAFGGLG